MATAPGTSSLPKPSFASVVAMAPRLPDAKPRAAASPRSPDRSAFKRNNKQTPESPSAAQLQRELQGSMTRLGISENSGTHIASASNNTSRPALRVDDDQTQLSCSSTKPASSDSRSATSGVTYAMDERESLRPDDSASTKAAEDEDSCSGPASGAPSSRVGSEAGGRAFQDQFNEISGRIGPGLHRLQSGYRRGIPGIAEEAPQPVPTPLIPKAPAASDEPATLVVDQGSPFPPGHVKPDEKLLEALESSKDRLFLMRLEQEVIAFVKDSTEPTLDLPPCNSFCRLLAHKMADYYALTHYVDNAVTSVRLYRTPYCRIRQPLSSLVKDQSPSEITPTSQPSFQIMRREGAGRESRNTGSAANTTASSMAPSKAGSETGDDSQHGTGFASPTESVSTREKATLTREEREAKYKETRERIFKGIVEMEPEDTSSSHEVANEVSRTSSGNGRKKSKKSRRNNDDFEARSQFGIYYPAAHYPPTSFGPTPSPPAYYGNFAHQGNAVGQSGTLGVDMLPQNYNQGFNTMPDAPAYSMSVQNQMPTSDFHGPYAGVPMYPEYCQQYPPPYYQHTMQHQIMGQHSSAMSSPAPSSHGLVSQPSSQMAEQNWMQNGFQYSYQFPKQPLQGYVPQVQERNVSSGGSTISYAYSQMPFQSSAQQGVPQHPLTGSYNRPSFNPQSRSFVPSSTYQPANTLPYSNPPNNAQNSSAPQTLGNSSSNLPQNQASGIYPRPTPFSMPLNVNQSRKTSGQSIASRSAPQPSSLAKWGTPANLPPKPPPPEVTSVIEGQHSLPANIHAPLNIQPIMNGQLPSFQNGVYSMPGSGGH